jgi:hypothetical protein
VNASPRKVKALTLSDADLFAAVLILRVDCDVRSVRGDQCPSALLSSEVSKDERLDLQSRQRRPRDGKWDGEFEERG